MSSQKINPEVKKKWVEALRSGKFEQGRSRLVGISSKPKDIVGEAKSDKCYCCLGVLCEVYAEDTKMTGKQKNEFIHEVSTNEAPALTPGFSKWLGLGKVSKREGGYFTFNPNLTVEIDEEKESESIAELNDDYEFTFQDLATLIEEQL